MPHNIWVTHWTLLQLHYSWLLHISLLLHAPSFKTVEYFRTSWLAVKDVVKFFCNSFLQQFSVAVCHTMHFNRQFGDLGHSCIVKVIEVAALYNDWVSVMTSSTWMDGGTLSECLDKCLFVIPRIYNIGRQKDRLQSGICFYCDFRL